MIYHPELYYFFDTKDFPLKKALLVTAKAVSKYCHDFEAKLISAKRGVGGTERQGILPADKRDREKLFDDLFDWIWDNSECPDLFALFLYGEKRNISPDECEKFDHHDDTCCWGLNLTEKEFAEVQEEWRKNNLPMDLFYPRDLAVQKGWCSYTPKRWEVRNTK